MRFLVKNYPYDMFGRYSRYRAVTQPLIAMREGDVTPGSDFTPQTVSKQYEITESSARKTQRFEVSRGVRGIDQ